MSKKTSNKKWLWIGGAVIVALAAAAFIKSKNSNSATKVETTLSTKENLRETISASGKIFPEKEVIISSDVSGEITNLAVAEGDSVVKGQLIAQIDPESYLSVVEQSKAALNNVLAQYESSKSNLATAQARLKQAIAQKEIQKGIYDRNKKLFDQGIISASDFDNFQTTWQNAQTEVETAQLGVEAAEANVKSAEFTVASQRASLKEVNTSLNRTKIYAPNSGIITRLSVEEGERVVGTMQMTGTEMMRVSDLEDIEVQVEVSENDIPKVTLGDSAIIEIDAYFEKEFKGIVSEVSNSSLNVDLTSDLVSNFIVKVRILKSSYEDLITEKNRYPFRTGMSAAVEIITTKKSDVVAVPIQSVTIREIEEEEKEVVLLVQADTIAYQPVQTGIQNDEFIEIVSGLSENTEIVMGPYALVSKDLEKGEKVQKMTEDDKKEKDKK